MITIKLILPTTIDRRNPVSANQCIRHQQYLIETTPNQTGYTASDTIKVRGIEYEVSANLTVAGDQINGNVSFLNKSKNVTTNNVLQSQKTSFPNLPVFNEWTGIKLSGFGDFGTIELSDRTLAGGSGGGGSKDKNDAVVALLEATALDKSLNSIIAIDSKELTLRKVNNINWTYPEAVVNLAVVGNEVAALQFKVSELNLVIKPGMAQIFGQLSSSIQYADGEPTTHVDQFNSPPTATLYNSVFPWSNQWNLVDTLDPSLAIGSVVDYNDPNIQINVRLQITGSKL